MPEEQVTMGIILGITDELDGVTVEFHKNGIPIGWIKLNRENAENFAKNVNKYAALLKKETMQ